MVVKNVASMSAWSDAVRRDRTVHVVRNDTQMKRMSSVFQPRAWVIGNLLALKLDQTAGLPEHSWAADTCGVLVDHTN